MLQGADALARRLQAVGKAGKPMGDAWAKSALAETRRRIRVRTGKTRASLRLASSAKGGLLSGSAVALILDRGARAHDITAKGGSLKFNVRGATIFAKKVHKPRQQGQPYLRASAEKGLTESHPADVIIAAWNQAA